MGKLIVDYSELEKASKEAQNTAEEAEDYANAIQKHVVNPLQNVTGGQHHNTSVAISMANDKIKMLRSNATWYRDLSGKLNTFGTHAEAADKNVHSKLSSIQKEWYQNLNFLQKIMINTYSVYSHSIGRTKFGKFMMTVGGVRSYFIERGKSMVQSVRRWFQYGNGRYFLNIVGAGLSIGVALASLVATCVAPNPATLAVFIGSCALLYKSVKEVMTIADNADAWGTSATDPGLARYKGNTKSVLDFVKKRFHNKTAQAVAGGFDIFGAVVEIADTAIGFTKPTIDVPEGAKEIPTAATWSIKNVGPNILKNLGVENGKFSVGKLIQEVSGYKIPGGKSTAKDVLTITKDVSNGVKGFQTFNKIMTGEMKDGKEITRTILKHVPNVKDIVKTVESIEDIGKYSSAFK